MVRPGTGQVKVRARHTKGYQKILGFCAKAVDRPLGPCLQVARQEASRRLASTSNRLENNVQIFVWGRWGLTFCILSTMYSRSISLESEKEGCSNFITISRTSLACSLKLSISSAECLPSFSTSQFGNFSSSSFIGS